MADEHPHIIKMPDEPPQSEYGIGYEIFHAMKENSDNVAQYIVQTEESQTHGDLLDNCIRVAINLRAENIGDDDIIGICAWNHKNACVPYIAGLFIGKKVTALDPGLVPEEKANMLVRVTPKIIFVDDSELSSLEESLSIAKLKITLIVIGTNTKGYKSLDDFLKASDADIRNFQPTKLSSNKDTAIIFFSSGTSGVPKGICISHYAILARTSGFIVPVSIAFVQLNWISYALSILRALRMGTAWVLMEDFVVEDVWIAIEKYKINLLFAKVFQLAKLSTSSKPPHLDTSSLKIIISSGAAFPKEILLATKQLFPGVIVLQSYGLTEICGLALSFNMSLKEHREWQIQKPSSCGTPIDGIWYKIADPETDEILGPNKQGELRFKSKLLMNGYHNMDSKEAFDKDGWLKTGDILEYDENHCFFFVDRIKELIKYRCFPIYTTYLEEMLMTHPAVSQAAVVGIPHPEDSEHALGIVTLNEGCHVDPKELELYVEERVMDRYRLRHGVKIIKNMPYTNTGKILKRSLKKMVLDGEI